MAAAWGAATVRRAHPRPRRGVRVVHDGRGRMDGMPADFIAARYHSLCIDPATLPATSS